MKKISVETKIVGGFVAALVVFLLAGGQMYRSLMEYRENSRLVAHTHLVLEAVEKVRLIINELVSSQRTYIITGKELYLAENEREMVDLRLALARIRQLTADNQPQQLRSVVLSQLTEERLKLMNDNILRYRTLGFEAARERINNGIADVRMEMLLKQCDAMREEELSLLKQRSDQAESNATATLRVGGLMVATTLCGLALLWWRIRRSEQQRQTSESLAQESQMLKQVSDGLVREDKINTAYGDMLTLINQDWFKLSDMIHAALMQLNTHASIMTGVTYLAQNDGLVPISAIGIPLPVAAGSMALEALQRNEIISLNKIPTDSVVSVSTATGSIVPREIIAIPLTVKNEVIAVLELSSLLGFAEHDLRVINRIVPQLGISINQKKLEQEIMLRSSQLETANYELVTINDESVKLNESLQLLNEELKGQQSRVADTNKRLEEVSRSKSDFLANMSHELRTPLNSVIGFSEVLQDQMFGPLNAKQLEYVNNILVSGRHQLSLINDILDLSKIESGKMELELSEFSLRETLDASVMMLKEKALKGGINLNMTLDPLADMLIVADQRKLKQIMFNLVSNAVKFTPSGGSVDIRAVRDNDFIEVTVADTGIGIKEEDIQKLFHPFTQLESVYTKEYEGTGLGLALNRQLVELHGGRIWVESRFGSGSNFSFTIPVNQSTARVPPPVSPDTARGTGNTVLLIEDDPLTLAAMEKILQSKGYQTLRASSGKKGVEIAERDRPDMIVLDLMMPDMNGFEVAEQLKDTTAAVNIPILVLTSMDFSVAERAQLAEKVWRIEGKGSLSTHEFLNLVERAISPPK